MKIKKISIILAGLGVMVATKHIVVPASKGFKESRLRKLSKNGINRKFRGDSKIINFEGLDFD